jgi:hypothetical protein
MAIQLLPQGDIGDVYGKALSTGLENLAHASMQNLQKRNLATSLKHLGLSNEHAAAIPSLPQETQRDVLKEVLPEKIGGVPNVKHQARIEAANKPFLETFSPEVNAAKKLNELAQHALGVISTGKSEEGLKGSILGSSNFTASQLSGEGQDLLATYNEIAELLAARRKGPQTAARIKLANSIKANLGQSKAVQIKRLEKVIEDAQPFLQKDAIREQLVEANNGRQPANLEGKVNKAYRLQQMGNPRGFSVDTTFELDGVDYKPNADKTDWVPV